MAEGFGFFPPGTSFQCVYCEQTCSSYAILRSHEGDCSKRKVFTRTYDDARRKHSRRIVMMAESRGLEPRTV